MRNWNDVGVVVLGEPGVGITPATIAPANRLDRFPPKVLSKTLFTELPGQKLTPQIPAQRQREDPRGTGGTCFGDSGGPSFQGGYQVTVTRYGYTSNCRYIDGFQRVDIPVVQDWLDTFGVTAAP